MIFIPIEIVQEVDTVKQYRILWVESEQSYLYMIELNNPQGLPIRMDIDYLRTAIAGGEWRKLAGDSQLLKAPSKKYREKHRRNRDSVWAIIEPLVSDEPNIYLKKVRTGMIRDARERHQVSYPYIRKYLYKYWAGGKRIDALLPDFRNSGAKGQEKAESEQKRGRPKRGSVVGKNITKKDKANMQKALRKYSVNKKSNKLTVAYRFLLKEYYAQNAYYDENGTEKIILKDADNVPSLNQFRYWFEKQNDIVSVIKARKGEKEFNKNHRAVLSTSISEVHGPGSRFQIDATPFDVHLVAELNRNSNIGRPILYLILDVFSRMIVGFHVGLAGPSWSSAMMAVHNIVADKRVLCAEYGVTYREEEWPCAQLPEILLADRGEFEGYNPERLVSAFNIQVENTSSSRADMKGLVEKHFDLMHMRAKPHLPGFIEKDFRERGAHDYRQDAALTLRSFTRFIIEAIRYYNQSYMPSYTRDRDVVEANVPPIPLELWNWGVRNRSGKLSAYSEEMVRLHLLPRKDATVTENGIKFEGIFYSCESAIKGSWFERAGYRGTWKVSLAHDPRNMNYAFVVDEAEGLFEPCYMTPKSERYRGLSLVDIQEVRRSEGLDALENTHPQLQRDVDFISTAEAVVDQDVKEAKAQQNPNLSKRERVSGVEENRKVENDRLNQKLYPIKEDGQWQGSNVIPFKNAVDVVKEEEGDVRKFLKKKEDE